ncbi:MAG: hypothetical protein CMK89_22810 [Pseudomonadales bacterium]|nr:hypothetical protein [Pseudomonadales bacterium]
MHMSGIAKTLLLLMMTSILAVTLPGCGGSKSSRSDDQDRSAQEPPSDTGQGTDPEDEPGDEPEDPQDPGDQPEPLVSPSVAFILTDTGPMGPGRIVDSTVRFSGNANPYDSVLVIVNEVPSGSVLANANGKWELDFTRIELLPGEYRIDVRAVTSGGETLDSQQPFLFTYDPTLPVSPQILSISNDTGQPGDGITSDPGQVLLGSAVAGYLIEVFVNGASLGETAADEQGQWSLDLGAVNALPADGVYQLTAVSKDFGLQSPASQPYGLTLDTTAPGPAALQPSPNSNGVPRSPALQIEFDEPVLPGTGQIILRRVADNALISSTGVDSLDLGAAGGRQIPIPLGTLLNFATGYYVEVPAGAFQDLAGNPSAAIQGPQAWAFDVEQASFPPIDIGALTPDQGYRFAGASPLGAAVAGVGDVNGDGFEDFAVADPGFEAERGALYLISGRSGLTRSNLSQADWSPADGVRFLGANAGDQLGTAVASAGDMNGDGIDDLMLAAPGSDLGATDAGVVYVVWGSATLGDLDLGVWDTNTGFRILAREPGQRLGDASLSALDLPGNGQGLSAVGDYNGDGFADLVLGHPQSDTGGENSGRAYVILGQAGAARTDVDLSLLGADGLSVSATGQSQWRLGYSVLLAGDLNRDGLDDLVLSAPTADTVFIIYGRPGSNPGNLDVGSLTSSVGVRWQSSESGSLLGASLGAGEFNGDGVVDVFLGQPARDNGAEQNTGSAYVLFGGKAWSAVNEVETLSATQGFTLSGIDADSFTGQAVSGAGDINADGLDDLLLGAYNGQYGGVRSGRAWVVLGSDDDVIESWSLVDFLASDGIPLKGSVAGDALGQSLSAADHNGDGFSDVILGAPGNAETPGQAAILWGNDWLGDVVFRSGQAGADNIVGSAVGETLTGNGGADAFSAGAGDDRIEIADTAFFRVRGGTGEDTLALTGSNLFLDLPSLPPEAVNSIEVIDLGDSNNRLKVSRSSVLRLSGTTNRLRINGGPSDVFEGDSGDNWTVVEETQLDGVVYTRYADGEAELLVESSVIQPGVERLQSSQRYYFDTTNNGAGVAGDVSQFPLLLRITDAEIIDAVQPGAPDIRFVDSDGTTRLPYEIERWNQNADEALVWVLVPQVDGDSNTDFITLQYDDAIDGTVSDGQDPAALWKDYVGVWHFAEAGEARDSSPFANHGLDVGGVSNIESFIGRGAAFTDDEAYRVPYSDSIAADGGAFSVEAWYTSNTCTTSLLSRFDLNMLSRGDNVAGFWEMKSAHYVASIIVIGTRVDRASFTVGTSNNASSLSGGSLFGLFIGDCQEHVMATYDPILGASIYINGVLRQTNDRRYTLASTGDLIIGGHGTNYRLTLDESRLARRLWDADRVSLTYQNQRADSTLVSPR